MTDNTVFRAANRHVQGCGTPPCIDEPSANSRDFRSYFENDFGDQWILHYDSVADSINVHSGDCGWDTELKVRTFEESLASLPAKYASMFSKASTSDRQSPVVCGKNGPIVIGKPEQKWIAACMMVIDARRAAAETLTQSN
jgi:hypothetical protein